MTRLAQGGFEITRIEAGIYHWDGGAIFGVVPKTLWSKVAPADELNRVAMAFNCYVIQTGDHTILVETGEGGKMPEKARARMKLPAIHKPLSEILAENSINPDKIDCTWALGGQALTCWYTGLVADGEAHFHKLFFKVINM